MHDEGPGMLSPFYSMPFRVSKIIFCLDVVLIADGYSQYIVNIFYYVRSVVILFICCYKHRIETSIDNEYCDSLFLWFCLRVPYSDMLPFNREEVEDYSIWTCEHF
jgi:hypothetical protein